MELSTIERNLIKAIEEFEIIDCHEHLPPEKERTQREVDVFTLFSHYTHADLVLAGMSEQDYQSLYNQNISFERRWAIFKPYWEEIRWDLYARAVLITVKEFYGFDDINDKTYKPISDAIKKANKAGVYKRVLQDRCKIRTALTQCNRTGLGTPLLTPVMPLDYEMETWGKLSRPIFEPNAIIRSLDDYLDAVKRYVVRVKSEGAVGLKMFSSPYERPNRQEAINIFERLRTGVEVSLPQPNPFLQPHPLRDYIVDETISFVSEQGLVIAVHTGYWADFRQFNPLHMIPILQRHPKARFDIYHLGYPWVRETLMLGKGFPNVWLNFCWTHIISQRFAIEGLDEAIDLIPMNKILAFGGDYHIPVEKIYGHLVMAREDIAKVLAKRIQEKQMTEKQALEIAKKMVLG